MYGLEIPNRNKIYASTWEKVRKPCRIIEHGGGSGIYIATDFGVEVSFNQGESWISLCSNLPTTFVHDMVVYLRNDLLVIGTHGCSVYIMDVGPVHEYDLKISGRDFHMFGTPTV